MLATAGFLTIFVLLALIISKRSSALMALAVVPAIAALICGFGWQTNTFIITGMKNIAPIAAMFIFAILYFSILYDTGMFDPIIRGIIRMARGNPVGIVMGTFVLACCSHFDGSAASTYLITISAMLPLYERLKLDRRVLACMAALGAGIMNMVPWGGPTLRAASALKLNLSELYTPVIPAQVAGIIFIFGVAWWLGRREAKRIGYTAGNVDAMNLEQVLTDEEKALRRPKLFWFNVVLTAVTIVLLVHGKLAPAVCFLFALIVLVAVNYPNVSFQQERMNSHAKSALLMATVLFSAGAFIGIMQGTGFLKAMAVAAASMIPQEMAQHIPFVTGIFSLPLSLVFDPDSFYFGVLPVIAETASTLGVPALQVGQAAILGQMTVGCSISPLTPSFFLLIGLAKVDIGEHQRFTIPFSWATSIVMTFVCVIMGLFPL